MEIIKGKQEKAQRVVIYGTEGVGKTTFASKFPNVLYIDTEDGSSHLDVARLQKPTSWQMLIQQTLFVRDKKPCSTLVVDTLDWAETLLINHMLAKEVNATNLATWGGGYGAGYSALETEWGKYLNLLQEIVDGGIHVVGLAHAKITKFDAPTEIGSYDRWELKLEKKTAGITKEWADIVLFANFDVDVLNVDGKGETKGKNKARGSGKRVMYTSHQPAFDAKNRHGFPLELPFDYEQIGAAFKDLQEGVQKPTQTKKAAAVEPKETFQVNTPKLKAVKDDVAFPNVVGADMLNNIDAVSNKEYDKTGIDVFPVSLQDLMIADKITLKELQEVIAMKGYYPLDTPPKNYDAGFIDGALIGAWDQVRDLIIKERLPF